MAVNYDKDSFLSGLAVGRQLKGWASGGGGGGVIQPLAVTDNGTYTPPAGVDGYAPVTVGVAGGLPWMLDAGILWDLMPFIFEIEEGS